MVMSIWPAIEIRDHRRAAAIGNVDDIGPGFDLEQFRHQMRTDADGVAVVQLARIGLGVPDQLQDRFHRQGRPGDQHQLVDRDRRDRGKGFVWIIVELVEERLAAEGADRSHQQRVAVGRRTRDLLRSDGAAGAALVLDDDGLPESKLQPLRNQPRRGVGRSARREWHHELDGPIRIALRENEAGRAGDHRGRGDGRKDRSDARNRSLPPVCHSDTPILANLVVL